jgi:hypothetical protein
MMNSQVTSVVDSAPTPTGIADAHPRSRDEDPYCFTAFADRERQRRLRMRLRIVTPFAWHQWGVRFLHITSATMCRN